VAQPLLEAGEKAFLVPRLHVDDAVGREAGLGYGRSEQVLAGDAPKDLATRPGGNPGGKQRGGRSVDYPIAAPSDLMQRAEREAASWEAPVNLLDAERKRRATARRPALKALNALSKLLDNRGAWGIHFLFNSLSG
jgi:hypothetical protein